MSLEDIAKIEGVSFQMIQQVINKAVKKLTKLIKKGLY